MFLAQECVTFFHLFVLGIPMSEKVAESQIPVNDEDTSLTTSTGKQHVQIVC